MGSNVSKNEANVHSVSIGNRYNKTILVKYDVQEKFVTLEEFAIKGGVTAAGFGAEGGGRQKKQYDWNKINIQFTPIRPGKFLYRKGADKDVYLSIITEDGDVIVNTWYVSKKSNFVVTEDMDLMEADDKEPLKVHKDFVKICQEPRATDYFEDKKRDRLRSIGNRYKKTIFVKCDAQEKFVTLEEFAIKGSVNVAGFGAEGGGRQKKQYDWIKINIQFTPIRPGKFLHRKVTNEDVFLSIITVDGDVIVNAWYDSKKVSFVVTEDMDLMEADDKDPLKVHQDFVKIYPETRATKSSEDKERDSSTKQQPVTRRLDITQIKAEKSTSLDVKVDSDDYVWDFRGLAVTSNGTLLLADWVNDTIKNVSPDNGVLSVLKMPYSPDTVAVLDSSTAVISSDSKNLYIIDISDPTALTIKKEIQLRFEVLALAKYRSGLIVTCYTKPASTKLIDFSGKELWSITKDESEEDLFGYPCGIVLFEIDNEDTAVVIDNNESTITLLGAENGRLMRVINVDEKQPYRITIDNDCNVYVVYENSYEISVWSRDFKSNRILLSKKDLARRMPCAIVYSEVTDSLYISYRKRNEIDCFRLK